MRFRSLPSLLAGLLVLAACSAPAPDTPPPPAVLVRSVDAAGAPPAVQVYAGEVRARIESDLGFRIGGKLVERLVDVGADVAAVFETKRAMLACHVSQDAWVARQHDIPDHLASMERWTRRRARDFGAELAEGFRQYRHHPYPKTPLLQEMLGASLLAPPPQAPRAAS